MLNNLKGCCKPNTMTAILGPSGINLIYLLLYLGQDKTILLNLLSGRLSNAEMSANGILKFNNVKINDA